jgi:hypothetical protein
MNSLLQRIASLMQSAVFCCLGHRTYTESDIPIKPAFRGGNKMKNSVLGQWIVVLSLLSALVRWAGVSIPEAVAMRKDGDAPAPSKDPAAIEAVRSVERDIGDAMVAVDIDKLDQIFADNWATIGRSGSIITKEKVLQDFKSGKDKLVSHESGPIDVRWSCAVQARV